MDTQRANDVEDLRASERQEEEATSDENEQERQASTSPKVHENLESR